MVESGGGQFTSSMRLAGSTANWPGITRNRVIFGLKTRFLRKSGFGQSVDKFACRPSPTGAKRHLMPRRRNPNPSKAAERTRRWRKKRRQTEASPMSEDMPAIVAPSPTLEASPTPAPAPGGPAPGATVTVVPLHLTDEAVAVLREIGFLKVDQPTVRDIEAAVQAALN